MKRLLITTLTFGLLLLLHKPASAQQDAQYSQYLFNGIYINPAYAGYKENLNLHSFYRSQWTGIKGAPKSMSLALDAIANEGNVGLALQLSSDQLGAQTNLSAYGNYAYRIRLNNDGSSRLAFGLGFGMIQLGIDGAKLNPNEPEPDQPYGMESVVLPDARVGVYYSTNTFFAGFSVDNIVSQHFNVRKRAFVPQPKPHYYLTAGTLIPLSADIKLKPSVLLKDDAAGPTSLDLNAFVLFGDRLWLGGSYRTGVKLYNKDHIQKNLTHMNSAVGAIEFFATDRLRLGYAYDFSIGPLQGYSSGSHELSIGIYFLRPKVRMTTPRYF